MDNYWVTVNDIDNYIDLVFENSNFDLINVLFHLVDISWLEELKIEINNTVAKNNEKIYVQKSYGDCIVMTTRDYAVVILREYKGRNNICLNLSLFKSVLSDYIDAYNEFISKKKPHSK